MLIDNMGCTPFDLHVHTNQVSCCGKLPAEHIVRLYKASEYGGIFITDHLNRYTFERLCAPEGGDWHDLKISWEEFVYRYEAGYRAAKAEGDRIGFTIYPGIELALDSGPEDYLIWGADEEFLLRHPMIHTLSLEELYKVTREENLPLIQAHPMRDYLSMMPFEFLDGYEVFNGAGEDYNHNIKAQAVVDQIEGAAQTGGSDAHAENTLLRSGMWLPADISDYKELARYIIKYNKELKIIRH